LNITITNIITIKNVRFSKGDFADFEANAQARLADLSSSEVKITSSGAGVFGFAASCAILFDDPWLHEF
jgi:hypothetical protein